MVKCIQICTLKKKLDIFETHHDMCFILNQIAYNLDIIYYKYLQERFYYITRDHVEIGTIINFWPIFHNFQEKDLLPEPKLSHVLDKCWYYFL